MIGNQLCGLITWELVAHWEQLWYIMYSELYDNWLDELQEWNIIYYN